MTDYCIKTIVDRLPHMSRFTGRKANQHQNRYLRRQHLLFPSLGSQSSSFRFVPGQHVISLCFRANTPALIGHGKGLMNYALHRPSMSNGKCLFCLRPKLARCMLQNNANEAFKPCCRRRRRRLNIARFLQQLSPHFDPNPK